MVVMLLTPSSTFRPIPVLAMVLAHCLEFADVISGRVAEVLRPMVTPAKVLSELVADVLRHDVHIIATDLGVSATIGVVSAGVDESGEVEEGDDGGFHVFDD